MQMKRLIIGIGAAVALCLWWGFFQPALKGAPDRPHFEHSELSVTTSAGKKISFKMEVARSEDEQSYGLMFVQRLPQDQGMIFPYAPPREISFWMKNTLIPLDMLFIRPDQTIGRIVSHATPQDLTPIPSLEPVSAVIEINAGLAKQDGIAVGDKVTSPIF